jgi:hypothetical protein
MRFQKFVLPDVVDKTTSFKRLSKVKKSFRVPSLPETVRIIRDIEFEEPETDRFSTIGGIRIQEQAIVENFYRNNQEEIPGAQVHHQGRVYFYRVEEYKKNTLGLTQTTVYDREYQEVPILQIRDLNNPSRKCTDRYRRNSRHTRLVPGWEEIFTDYDILKYKRRQGRSILRIPKKIYLPTVVLGSGFWISNRSDAAGRQRLLELRNFQLRRDIFKYLTHTWVKNDVQYNAYQEIEYRVNCTTGIFPIDKTRWEPFEEQVEDTYTLRTYSTKRKILTITSDSEEFPGTKYTCICTKTYKLRSGDIYYSITGVPNLDSI